MMEHVYVVCERKFCLVVKKYDSWIVQIRYIIQDWLRIMLRHLLLNTAPDLLNTHVAITAKQFYKCAENMAVVRRIFLYMIVRSGFIIDPLFSRHWLIAAEWEHNVVRNVQASCSFYFTIAYMVVYVLWSIWYSAEKHPAELNLTSPHFSLLLARENNHYQPWASTELIRTYTIGQKGHICDPWTITPDATTNHVMFSDFSASSGTYILIRVSKSAPPTKPAAHCLHSWTLHHIPNIPIAGRTYKISGIAYRVSSGSLVPLISQTVCYSVQFLYNTLTWYALWEQSLFVLTCR